MKDYQNIALRFARKHGYDTVRPAGQRDGYRYFHYFSEATIGRKTGWPKFVKVSEYGKPSPVENLSERMWALKQEVSLNDP